MLVRFDPFRLVRFDPFREVDHVTQNLHPTWPSIPMDAHRRNGDFVVSFDLPGVSPDGIDLTVEKNVLTVTAERSLARAEGDEIVVAERRQGRLSRRLSLGEALDTDHISAHYDAGVLTLRIPVAEKAKPRKVEVTAGADRAVEVTAGAE